MYKKDFEQDEVYNMSINIPGTKAASATFASVLVFVITVALVIYIVSIPPEDRVALISGNPEDIGNYNNGVSGSEKVYDDNDFLFTGPGFVDDSDDGGSTKKLPSVTLRTNVGSKILAEASAFYVIQSFRKDEDKIFSFHIEDYKATDNVYMTFKAVKREGILKIKLNNNVIYEGELDKATFSPMKISSNMLSENNVLEFSVNEVGLVFWKKNEYIIEDFKIFGDVIERSEQSSYVTFDLGATEKKFLQKATLSFYPVCDYGEVNKLRISVNKREIYYQIPDCKVLNKYDIPSSFLLEGTNSLEFETEEDTYLIDRIEIETALKENDDYVYYFDLDKDLFNLYTESEAVCGEIDGSCPDHCSEDEDKDCCFLEYSGDGYWCDVFTANANDRCVGKVDRYNFNRCPSGYEDKRGNPHDDFESFCGDDTDGRCPIGCPPEYDKDCCLEDDSGNFWCDDLPLNGVEGICMFSLTNDQCALCPSGYEGEDQDPDCEYDSRNTFTYESDLKSEYGVKMTLKFVEDDDRKRGIIKVNGYEMSFSTFEDEYGRNIDDFVEEGTNYIQIIPQNSYHLVSLRVRVEED